MKLIHDPGGMISEGPIWILFEDCYMYTDSSLVRLVWIVLTQWRHDRHLVG